MRLLLLTAAVWIVFGLYATGAFRVLNPTRGTLLQIGADAPLFALKDQDGRTHSLKDYAGRAVVLAFVPDAGAATVAQLRSLHAAERQFDTLGVKVFAIAHLDTPTAKRLHDTEALNFPVLSDANSESARAYGLEGRAAGADRVSYVVGTDGKILLPVASVQSDRHGAQLVELAECCLDSKPQPASRFVGKPIADFTLPDVAEGKPISLYGDRRQKATVIFITSSECPCSAKYDARFVDYARRYASQGVRFVAVNSSNGETVGQIAQRAKAAGYPFPVLKDEGNVIADRIEAKVTPETFVLDSRGVLRYHGRIDDSRDASQVQAHDLQNALDFLLAGKNPPHSEMMAFGCAIARKSITSTIKDGSNRL